MMQTPSYLFHLPATPLSRSCSQARLGHIHYRVHLQKDWPNPSHGCYQQQGDIRIPEREGVVLKRLRQQ